MKVDKISWALNTDGGREGAVRKLLIIPSGVPVFKEHTEKE